MTIIFFFFLNNCYKWILKSFKIELLETDLVVARDDKLVNVTSTFEVIEPVLEMTPGQGVTCGSLNCHKYASCQVHFGLEQLPNCVCPEGFAGN